MFCDTCGEDKPLSKFNLESFSPETCFHCRVQGVKLGIPGKAQDQDLWRHSTLAEQQRTTVEEGRANGLDPVPAWTTTSSAPTQKQLDKLKEHHAK